MANLILCDDILSPLLDALARSAPANPVLFHAEMRLTTSNVTFSDARVLSDFTEASFPGYAAIQLNLADFPAATVAAHVASSLSTQTFNFACTGGGSPQTIYGMYLTDSGTTKLWACAVLDQGPTTVVNNGDQISEVLTVQTKSIFAS